MRPSSDPGSGWRVGADIGGTFTDVIAIGPAGPHSAAHAGSSLREGRLGLFGAAPVDLRILAINDFHGHLHATRESLALRAADGSLVSMTIAGDVAKLATVVDAIRAKSSHFAFVSAGDLVKIAAV